MTVNKITSPVTPLELIDKTNEIIDNLGGGGGSSLTAGNGININESDEIDIIQQDTTGITTNYTVVGSPTISSSYVASGFSDSNYLTIHNPIVSANSFTMHFKFSITSVSTMGILDSDYATNNNTHTYRFTITSAGKLFFRCSRYGNDSYQLSITGTTVLSTNTIYYAKVEYDDVNGYKLYLSTDDINWNLEASSSEIFKSSYLTSSFIFKIGDNSANGNSFQGSIYLEDAYIDVNGSRAWEAVAITPALTVAKATNTLYGLVKPDGTTITVNNGVISSSGGTVTVDDALSTTSTNPVQNKVITNALPDTSQLSYYGTCATGASTQAKAVVCTGFELKEGASIRVKFTNAQSYNGQPTLNVNSTGAKNITLRGTTAGIRYMWQAGEVIEFTYDGTSWIWERGGTATTTYYGITKLATSATGTSTATALTPASLNQFAGSLVTDYPVYSASATYAVGDKVRYSYNAWECNTAITTAEAWDAAHWTQLPSLTTQIDEKQTTSNLVTSISASSTNAQYPSAKCMYDMIGNIETLLQGV